MKTAFPHFIKKKDDFNEIMLQWAMPNEVRRLVFTHAESTRALIDHGKRFDVPLPPGRLMRAKYSGGPDFGGASPSRARHTTITLTFFDDTVMEHKHVSVTAEFVLSALIEFCAANKIMLPRGAEKSLDVTEFNFCLDIRMASTADGVDAAPALELDD
jgi:hypothetical protein